MVATLCQYCKEGEPGNLMSELHWQETPRGLGGILLIEVYAT